MGKAERIAAGSIGIGVLVLAMKGVAWWITGSAALYSDALESTVNIAASVVALIALRFAARPADANHPFGHDKAEFFAAVIEGVLIVVAALSIFRHAWETWQDPQPILMPYEGLTRSPPRSTGSGPRCWSATAACCAPPPCRPMPGT